MGRLGLAVRAVWVAVAFFIGVAVWLWLRRSARGGGGSTVEPFQTATVTQPMREYFQRILRDSQSTDKAVADRAKTTIAAVTNPTETDSFKVVFPRQQSIAALAHSLGNTVMARNLLLNNYNMVEQQIMPSLNPTPGDIIAFNTNNLGFVCGQLVALSTDLKAKLATMKTGVNALDATRPSAIAVKDENMRFQRTLTAICQGNLSQSCRDLASVDSTLYPLLALYDSVGLTQAEQEGRLQDAVATINDVVRILKCPETAAVSYNQEDFPFIDSEELRLKLEEVSPYFLSPASLKFISDRLFDGEQVKFADSAREIGNELGNVMSEIADLNGYIISKDGKFTKAS